MYRFSFDSLSPAEPDGIGTTDEPGKPSSSFIFGVGLETYLIDNVVGYFRVREVDAGLQMNTNLPNVCPLPANGLTFDADGLKSSWRWSSIFTWTMLPPCWRNSDGNWLQRKLVNCIPTQCPISIVFHGNLITLWQCIPRILCSVSRRTYGVRLH